MSVYAAVAVNIIKSEIPAQFVLHLASHYKTESRHILHEIYVTILQKRQRNIIEIIVTDAIHFIYTVYIWSVCLLYSLKIFIIKDYVVSLLKEKWPLRLRYFRYVMNPKVAGCLCSLFFLADGGVQDHDWDDEGALWRITASSKVCVWDTDTSRLLQT